MGSFFWDERKVEWYDRALEESDYSKKILNIIIPLIQECKTIIDIGAGCGPLSIPLAELGYQVTALEPSPSMINKIRQKAEKKKLSNMKFLEAKFGEIDAGKHDAAIVANVRKLFVELDDFLKNLESVSPKITILIVGADTKNNKFFFSELYPILFNKEYPKKENHLAVFEKLTAKGLNPQSCIIDLNIDQPFYDIDEAVEFWKAYLNINNSKYDNILKNFLTEKLIKRDKWLIAEVKKRSAVIWWTSK
ncbi:MAG: class I SAM-dependent methyltransferase [Candidatus Schekmanbacteria bacterium]|nr:MAG: class I SAM-dependent methyltransferase [Candidatus Schekmanbacteria bacterium]